MEDVLFLAVFRWRFPQQFLHVAGEMGGCFEAHQVGHLGQRFRLVVEQRDEFEGGVVRDPLRGRKT